MMNARSFSIISVDEKKCVGCLICEVVCSLTKEKKINPDRIISVTIRLQALGQNLSIICFFRFNILARILMVSLAKIKIIRPDYCVARGKFSERKD